jgi:hypothetical protein
VKFIVKGKGKEKEKGQYRYKCYSNSDTFITRTYIKKRINISFNTKHISFYKIYLENDSLSDTDDDNESDSDSDNSIS